MSERTAKVFWSTLAALLVAWSVAFPIIDTDIWWHLAAAREMLARRAWLYVDPFSVSGAGTPWVNIHWLFQLLVFAVYAVGKETALVLVKCCVSGLAAAIVVAAVPVRARGLAALTLTLSVFAVRYLVMVRPVVLTLLCMATFFYVLERYRTVQRWQLLGWLLPIQLLWANCQGLHTLGPVLVGAYLIGERLAGREWRLLALAAPTCFVVSGVSPYGWRNALLPFTLLARIDPDLANIYAANVSEFIPPLALERLLPGSTLHLSLSLIALVLSFVLVRRQLVWAHLLVVTALTVSALMANRNTLLLYWLGVPVFAVNVMAETQPAWSRRWPQLFKRAVVGGAVTLVMVLLWIGTAHDGPLDTPAPFRVPQRSAEILMAGSTGGNVFCSVRHGGYLAWKLAPRFKPYIDGRLVLRTRAQFAEYLGVVDQPERFDALAKRHAFAAVVLPTAFPERYLGLLSYLAGHPNWRLAYTDGSEALFLPADEPRTAGPKIATMLHEIEQRYRDEPRRAALHNLARMLLVLQRPAEVRHVLAGLEDPTAQMLRAHSWYLERDLDQAERVAVRALAANAADLNSLNLLAAVAIDRGDLALALSYLGRVLHLDPYNTRGKSLLASIEARRAR